ncbi:hypothetical protein [Mesorhizobium sp. STM 4661]|uniref:hypothetical protein n=1 Tax=Mesorhizobium sp. STM 4661 TaxID=1297570 RepID=UPI0002BDCBC5|nr:hypothetical protein [Mesorhizobium sp. STM 4661]CCV16365.1 hypothetical protein MESS4_p20018 [Mesorhizobium sp. STM 4661]
MSRLNDPENFRGRVNYAAQVIAYGRRPTRAFDNCFENYDGDEVATAILRRSRKNARLGSNLQRYLSLASIEAAAERLADVPTRKLPEVARETRARRKAEFDVWFEQHRNADVAVPDTAEDDTRSTS